MTGLQLETRKLFLWSH